MADFIKGLAEVKQNKISLLLLIDGTLLGPLLFLAFINDLPDVIKSSSSKLFADNSAVFKVIQKDHDRQRLREDLTALEKWEETWQMSFNPTKCTVIRITPHCLEILETQYTLHGHTWRQQIPWSHHH